jgi:endonuclease YncB( thermonuclease family)
MFNRELVREGFCWWYRKYTPRVTVLEGLEGQKGLWADLQPVPPWEGRKRQDIGERGIVPEGKVRSATG